MKKIFGTALLLAVLAVLAFGSVALADDGVHTDWNFNGPGDIYIHTQKTGGAGGYDHFNLQSYAGGSSGWQNVSATPHGYSWCGTDFRIDRHAEVFGGTINTFTVRDNTYTYWPAYTEYGAFVQTGGPCGYGSLDQHFYNTYSSGGMSTQLYADCLYTIGAHVEGWDGGYFYFGLGAQGYGSAFLDLDTTDRSEHNGYRQLYGDYFLVADPAGAGLSAAWGNVADFWGVIVTPSIEQHFGVNVGDVVDKTPYYGGWKNASVTSSAPGNYNSGALADWVVIYGFINGMK